MSALVAESVRDVKHAVEENIKTTTKLLTETNDQLSEVGRQLKRIADILEMKG